jgi:drug/metabolite transporter (DMT)-like permease
MTKGQLYMVLSTFFFSFSYVLIKKSTGVIGFWETAFFRSILGLILISTYLKTKHIPLFGNRKNYPKLFLRGLFGGTGMIFYFAAFQKTTLANATSLHFTHPVFTTIFAFFILKETITKKKIIFVLIALFGVFFIFNPGSVISTGSIFALCSGLFASLAYITVRHLSSKEHPGVIINSLGLMTIILSLPLTVKNWTTPPLHIFLYLILIGILSTAGQVFLTMAYKLEKASQVAIFAFASILWSVLLGKLIFKEIPSIFEMFGILLIFFSMVALVKTMKKDK